MDFNQTFNNGKAMAMQVNTDLKHLKTIDVDTYVYGEFVPDKRLQMAICHTYGLQAAPQLILNLLDRIQSRFELDPVLRTLRKDVQIMESLDDYRSAIQQSGSSGMLWRVSGDFVNDDELNKLVKIEGMLNGDGDVTYLHLACEPDNGMKVYTQSSLNLLNCAKALNIKEYDTAAVTCKGMIIPDDLQQAVPQITAASRYENMLSFLVKYLTGRQKGESIDLMVKAYRTLMTVYALSYDLSQYTHCAFVVPSSRISHGAKQSQSVTDGKPISNNQGKSAASRMNLFG